VSAATSLSLSLSVHWKGMIVAKCTNTACGPAMAMGSTLVQTIEPRSDTLIGQDPRQMPHELNRISIGGPSMLPSAVLGNLQLGMASSLPMQHHVNSVAANVNNNLLEYSPEDPLLDFW
jgi:hypothetical protein